MGIDIYMSWDDQTPDEANAQITGFSIESGNVGYLREAYHGGPYATYILVPEAFDADDCEAQIPASTMRERLDETIDCAIYRAKVIYKEDIARDDPVAKSFSDFVALAEQVEARTGKPVTVRASY